MKRRKWRLSWRVTEVIVPLIQVLMEDTGPGGTIRIVGDLRGPKVSEKEGPREEMPVQRPVRKLIQWFVTDNWLQAYAELKDGSLLEVHVTDRIRHRKITKVSRSGKYKTKHKKKSVQRIDARRTLPRDAPPVRRPLAPTPNWLAVRAKGGKRTTLVATRKVGEVPGDVEQIQVIVNVLAELFRWTQPDDAPRRSA